MPGTVTSPAMTDRAVTDELLDGSAHFTADLHADGALVLTFVTSPVARARIVHLDTTPAAIQPGVVAVFTASDLPTEPIHEIALVPEEFAQPALADGEVRYVGEYVAAVVAESAAVAEDAVELVDVEYDALPSVNDRARGARGRARVGCARGRRRLRSRRAHRTCVAHDPAGGGGAHGGARDPRGARARRPAHGVRVDTGTALEPSPARAVARSPARLPPCGHAPRRRRLRRQGGRRCRPIRRRLRGRAASRPSRALRGATRSTTSRRCRGAGSPSRLHSTRGATARSSGSRSRSSATRARTPAPDRSSRGRRSSWRAGRTGSRRWGSGRAAYARTCASTGAYRGPGARRRPRRSSARSTCSHASSSSTPPRCGAATSSPRPSCPRPPPAARTTTTETSPRSSRSSSTAPSIARWREEQRTRRAASAVRVLGIGLATVLDSTAWFDAAGDRLRARARRRSCARVRGHRVGRTAARPRLSQRSWRRRLPVFVDEVEVVEGDTDIVEGGAGTSGSRSLQLAGGAVRGAAVDVLEQARQRAADLLEAAVDDVVVDGRAFVVRGAPARGITLAELAATRPPTRPRRALRVRPGGRHLHA